MLQRSINNKKHLSIDHPGTNEPFPAGEKGER